MARRVAQLAGLGCLLAAPGCRREPSAATEEPRTAASAEPRAPAHRDGAVGIPDASPPPAAPASSSDAGPKEVATVRFRLLDTTKVVMGAPPNSSRFGPRTEPELSFQKETAKPELFKLFPCGPGEMEQPAFHTCRSFELCRELSPEQLAQLKPALPQDTRSVMACARSKKGPAHLLALRVLEEAVVVELSRTDPEESSSLPHPLCRTCPSVKLRPWQETRRIPLAPHTEIHVEPAFRTPRTVGVDL